MAKVERFVKVLCAVLKRGMDFREWRNSLRRGVVGVAEAAAVYFRGEGDGDPSPPGLPLSLKGLC